MENSNQHGSMGENLQRLVLVNPPPKSKKVKRMPAKRTRRSPTKKTTARRGSTAAKRSAAAKKAAATRKRNAAKRSAAAKKAAATRKRNARRRPTTRRAKKGSVAKMLPKSVTPYYDALMKGSRQMMPAMYGVAGAAALLGTYNAVKPYAWDYIGLTGDGGVLLGDGVKGLVTKVVQGDAADDITMLFESALGLGTMFALGLAAKRGLGFQQKTVNSMFGTAAVLVGANALFGLKSFGVGDTMTKLSEGELNLSNIGLQSPFAGTLGSAHPTTAGYHPMAGEHAGTNNNLSKYLLSQNNSAASGPGFMGTKPKSLGMTLF